MNYQQIVVIGSGRVASRTLAAVLQLSKRPPVLAIEPEQPMTEALGATCRRNGIPCSRILSRDALVRFFAELPVRTLVLSAHNVFIFPPSLVDLERLTIVNFHNALLPRHRGRNAPSWALFEMDPSVGISWHGVTAGIDEGRILCQRQIRPAWDETALTLTRTLVDLGIDALADVLPELVSGTSRWTPQDPDVTPSFHRARDVPNQGLFDPSWPLAQASAFLRALDFGKLALFPQSRMRLDGDEHLIRGYRLSAESDEPAAHSCTRESGHTLRYCEAGLMLTVFLAPAPQVGRRRDPVLSQG